MTVATEKPAVRIIDPLGNTEGTCDKVRDPMKELAEFSGRVIWTCRKPASHDRRGAHLMVDDQGRKTYWRGADND
jgi:nucleoside-triphosphatase THEP1